jgi:hypothetical protein
MVLARISVVALSDDAIRAATRATHDRRTGRTAAPPVDTAKPQPVSTN